MERNANNIDRKHEHYTSRLGKQLMSKTEKHYVSKIELVSHTGEQLRSRKFELSRLAHGRALTSCPVELLTSRTRAGTMTRHPLTKLTNTLRTTASPRLHHPK